jgi:hypothetical protein
MHMGRSLSLGNLFEGGWWTRKQMCRECGQTTADDESWETEIHTGSFGVAVIDVCPRCDTVSKTRWAP